MKRFSSLLFLFFLLTTSLFPQEVYKLNWTSESIQLGSALALEIAADQISTSIKPLTLAEISSLDKNSINSFDRSAVNNWNTKAGSLSNVTLGLNFIAPAILLFGERGRKELTTGITMYSETMLYALAVNQITKMLVKRTRPYNYNSTVSSSEKTTLDARLSFYSGHTTISFASAVFLCKTFSDYYPDSKAKPYVIGFSLATAALTGYLRYESGNHFPTDIITGAVVGSAIGYFVPYFHKTSPASETSDKVSFNASASPMGIGFVVIF